MPANIPLEFIIVLSSSTDEVSAHLINKLASSTVGFYFLDSSTPSQLNITTPIVTISSTEYSVYRTKIPVYAIILNPLYFSHATKLSLELMQSVIHDTDGNRCLIIHPYKPLLIDKESTAAYQQSLFLIREILTAPFQYQNAYHVFVDELVSVTTCPYVSYSSLLHSNTKQSAFLQAVFNPEEHVGPIMSGDLIPSLATLLFGYPPHTSQVILRSSITISRINQILLLRSKGILSTNFQTTPDVGQIVDIRPISPGPFHQITINSSYSQSLQNHLTEANHFTSQFDENNLVTQTLIKTVQKNPQYSGKKHSFLGKLSRFRLVIFLLAIAGISLIIISSTKSSSPFPAGDSPKVSSVEVVNQSPPPIDDLNIISYAIQLPSQIREYFYNFSEERQTEKDRAALNLQIDSVATQTYLSVTDPSSPPTLPLISKLMALLERRHLYLKNPDELFSSTASISLIKIFHELALQSQPVKIIIIHQNDLELQATGGRIILISEIVLSSGRILDISHHQVSELDQSLQGLVTPPSDLSSLKSTSSWRLQDANWLPDFTSSAERISWFYQKQTGFRPDLVIGLTPTTINTLIQALSPTTRQSLAGIENNIREQLLNQYQYGSEKNSEWYSQQINSIFSLLTKLDSNDLTSVHSVMNPLINGQQLQIYSPHPSLQNLIRTAQLSGELESLPCLSQTESSCKSDFLAVNQTNLGINPVNAYISTTQSHAIIPTSDKIQHTHQIEVSNHSPTTNYPGGTYQAYVRFVLNRKPQDINLSINNQPQPDNQIIVTQENTTYTIGVPITVRVGETTILKAEYLYNLDNPSLTNQYLFALYKQPGVTSIFKGFTVPSGGGVGQNSLAPVVIQRPHVSSVQIAF